MATTKKYGIFIINTWSKYSHQGANELKYLKSSKLFSTKKEAINAIPARDGEFIILPVYIKTESQE